MLLVEKLWHVYLGITSKLPINSEGLQTLCDETKAIFFQHYKKPCVSQEGSDTWYNCPPSVHRVLDHAKIINDSLPGPPGLFSEEGSESNNKEFRRFRQCFTRKSDRVQTMEDLFCRLMCKSDPLVLSFDYASQQKHKNAHDMCDEIRTLLEEPSNDNFSDSVTVFEDLETNDYMDIDDDFMDVDDEEM